MTRLVKYIGPTTEGSFGGIVLNHAGFSARLLAPAAAGSGGIHITGSARRSETVLAEGARQCSAFPELVELKRNRRKAHTAPTETVGYGK